MLSNNKIDMHVLKAYVAKNNNEVRVLQYFNILSKFNLLENLYIVLRIYAQSDVRFKRL